MTSLFHRRPGSTSTRTVRGRRIRRTFTNSITASCNDELAVIAGHLGRDLAP